MLKTLLKLDSNLNGAIAHLFVEMTGQPMTTQMIRLIALILLNS